MFICYFPPRYEPCLILNYDTRHNVFILAVNTLEIILYKTVQQAIVLYSLMLLGCATKCLIHTIMKEETLNRSTHINPNRLPSFLEEQSIVHYPSIPGALSSAVEHWPSYVSWSVKFGIQSYWSQLFLISAKVIKSIEANCRSNIWSRTNEITKRALVTWSTTCLPLLVDYTCLISSYGTKQQ